MAQADGAASGVDLDRLTVPELAALRDAAEAKRLEKLDGAREAVLEEMRAKLAELGLTPEEALSAAPGGTRAPRRARKTRSDAGVRRPARYRGPGGETWGGRGRVPRWLRALEAAGRGREEFRA